MIHKFISADQLLSEAGYDCDSFSIATTVNDLRLLLKLRGRDKRIADELTLIDVDYFLIAKLSEPGLLETSIGGLPICNPQWTWPTRGLSPLQYMGRINLCDSIDILPKRFYDWGKRHVLQIFIPDVYMSDPSKEIVIQTVDLNKRICQLTDTDLPRGIVEMPKFSMMRTRVKCDPTVEYDDILEEIAEDNIWYPQGTRIPATDRSADLFHVDFSGLELYAERGGKRLEEIGVDIDSIDSKSLYFLKLSGGFLTVHVKYGNRIYLNGTMEYD